MNKMKVIAFMSVVMTVAYASAQDAETISMIEKTDEINVRSDIHNKDASTDQKASTELVVVENN